MKENHIYQKNVLNGLKELEDESVQTVITSPPYWGMRDYGVEGQIGLENSPFDYLDKLEKIFAEVQRVLKKDGTFWLNIGDTYNNSPCGHQNLGDTKKSMNKEIGNIHQSNFNASKKRKVSREGGLKKKELVGIPWRLALRLQKQGWYIRSDIIWRKPNPIPESVKDRPTKSHEHLFLLSKSQQYYYDYESIKVPCKSNPNNNKNRRDVWSIATRPFPKEHYAVFPEELIEPCILAGSKEGDIILDIFFGSGTTGKVALKNNRKFIGYELSEKSINIAYEELGEVEEEFLKK